MTMFHYNIDMNLGGSSYCILFFHKNNALEQVYNVLEKVYFFF